MLDQIDQEMEKRNIQAIIILGDTTLGDPNLTYVVGGNLPGGGLYFKRIGQEPLLVTSNLDAPTARKLGTVKRIETFTEWGLERFAQQYGRYEAKLHLLADILRKEGVDGKIALYGRNDLGHGTYFVDMLRNLGVNVAGDNSPSIVDTARETKDEKELEKLRDVGRRTGRVIEAIVDVLSSLKRNRGHLMLGKKRATIGAVKALISSNLAAEGLIAPEGTIFAIGASSADPHNAGTPSDAIKEGKLIVFDIFPQGESSYWSDITRTYIIGKASKKDKQLYETVHEAQRTSLDFIRPGVSGEEAMKKACDVIERHGYHTTRDIYEGKAEKLDSGFTHILGHGVGLMIHELPILGFLSKDPLRLGQVVTVEPGVYLPGYGGVRIEDTVSITPRGVSYLARVGKEFEVT